MPGRSKRSLWKSEPIDPDTSQWLAIGYGSSGYACAVGAAVGVATAVVCVVCVVVVVVVVSVCAAANAGSAITHAAAANSRTVFIADISSWRASQGPPYTGGPDKV